MLENQRGFVIDSPINTNNTPVIIGFLTYPYIPPTVNYFDGFQGANVPFPILINADIVNVKSLSMGTYGPKKSNLLKD